MGWEEFKRDVGSVYSLVKWVVIVVLVIGCGSCLIEVIAGKGVVNFLAFGY